MCSLSRACFSTGTSGSWSCASAFVTVAAIFGSLCIQKKNPLSLRVTAPFCFLALLITHLRSAPQQHTSLSLYPDEFCRVGTLEGSFYCQLFAETLTSKTTLRCTLADFVRYLRTWAMSYIYSKKEVPATWQCVKL